MGGRNPYLRDTGTRLPTRRYKVTFLPAGQTVEVDPAALPYGRHGESGSILDVALHHGVPIEHACGGLCACATCHVLVKAGLDSCSEPTDEEEDQLERAPGLRPESRLACQCVPDGSCDVIVEVPAWNRNVANEGT